MEAAKNHMGRGKYFCSICATWFICKDAALQTLLRKFNRLGETVAWGTHETELPRRNRGIVLMQHQTTMHTCICVASSLGDAFFIRSATSCLGETVAASYIQHQKHVFYIIYIYIYICIFVQECLRRNSLGVCMCITQRFNTALLVSKPEAWSRVNKFH